jgi:signal transduction histidine kinase
MRLLNLYNRYSIPILAIVFVFSGIFSYYFIRKILLDELDKSLQKEQTRIENYIQEKKQLPFIGTFSKEKIKFSKSKISIQPHYFNSIWTYKPQKERYDLYRQLNFMIQLKGDNYKFSITNELEGTNHLSRLLFCLTCATVLLMIVIIIIINKLVMKKLWNPFYLAIDEMRSFKINHEKLPVFPDTEIEEFKFMNDSLALAAKSALENFRILKEFTENASHEIQTPLAIIRSKLDLFVQEEGLSNNAIEYLKSTYSAIKKLSLLNKDLLLITKIENQQFEQKTRVNLKQVIGDKISEFKELVEIKEIGVFTLLQSAEIEINITLLDVLLSNLLSNAIKHNKRNGKIEMLLNENQFIILNTSSNKALDPQKIYCRFYKEDNSTENNGLGLSISRQICDSCSIKISYDYENEMHQFKLIW